MLLGVENISFYVFVGAPPGPDPRRAPPGSGEGPGEGSGPRALTWALVGPLLRVPVNTWTIVTGTKTWSVMAT